MFDDDVLISENSCGYSQEYIDDSASPEIVCLKDLMHAYRCKVVK